MRGAKDTLDVRPDNQGPVIRLPVSLAGIHQQRPAGGPDDQCAGGLPCIDVVNLKPARLPVATAGRVGPRNGWHPSSGHQAAAGQEEQTSAEYQEEAHAGLSAVAR